MRKQAMGCGCGCGGGPVEREMGSRPKRQQRNWLLLHGTTLGAARKIKHDQRMRSQVTYFSVGWRGRDLARWFAERAHARRPHDGGPAFVLASVPAADMERLRQLRLFHPKPFDPADAPALRGRTQWVLEPGGVDLLNRMVDRFGAVPITSNQ